MITNTASSDPMEGLHRAQPQISMSEVDVDMKQRLRDRIPTMDRILDITHQPGMSIGVIHHGKDVLKHNFGVRDTTTGLKPNGDTLYCIASLTKAFMAASIDQLVQEKKLSWDSTIKSVVPGFDRDDIFSHMTVRDICSHRTGLLSLDEITQGMDARILVDKKDVVKVSNALPAKHELRTNFLYNNALYALAGHIVEQVSDHDNWGHFQHDRIFEPLGMTRTTAFRSVHETDDNIATGYMVLTNGKLSPIAPTELSADSMNGGSGGVRSSVDDLLKWCRCLLASFHPSEQNTNKIVQPNSPIFNRSAIADAHSPTSAEGDYCQGWCYHQTPASLGLISPNRTLFSPILGAASPALQIYGHQGDVPGYTCNIYLIPATNSAVVILSNGTGLSDATDWIAQDLIQTMYELQPAIDFVDAALHARNIYRGHYERDFLNPLKEHQKLDTHPPPPPRISWDLDADSRDGMGAEKKKVLRMTVNKQADQVWNLTHYQSDVFSHLPDSADKCLARGLNRTLWSSFLTSFTRDDEGGAVNGIWWRLDGVDVHFTRHETSPTLS
ncbi:beta-lactamase/transpeptidase-like protein [Bombardia bombarda]|uniref:Beta-lactamase/transpeptidase-like protein n=1 Tax=Bombardia bombarda TaxID=252184 RepID=A0AA39X7S9_9PEZI|nr:beta-lactamase/transpeptidase-like protein [Bombardia bombarda]